MDLKLCHDHPWDVTVEQAMAIQRELASLIRPQWPRDIELAHVAGIDVSFPSRGVGRAAVVVLSYPDMRPVAQSLVERPITFPYVPGLLSFREVPVVLAALRGLPHMPDVLLCDGHGFAHPRRFGLACHLGLLLDHPSIGCAKSRLIGDETMPAQERGARTWLTDQGEVIGAVVRTRTGVRPVYVSVGHRVDLPTAADIVLSTATRYRLPEPARLAHQAAAGRQVARNDSQFRSP